MNLMHIALIILTIIVLIAGFHFATKGDLFMKHPSIEIRQYTNLPEMNLGWLSLRDHFIATVGPHSGQGKELNNLLVLADAKIQAKSRFPDHPHSDMEILTWVAQGTLQHLDNKGTNQTVPAEYLQLMSARDGIFHAEGNSSSEPLRILQIWINPNSKGGTPVVQQVGLKNKGFNLLAGPDNADLILRQNVWMYVARLHDEYEEFVVPDDKFAYVVSIGSLAWNGSMLQDGDGALIQSGKIGIKGSGQAIVILQNKQ